MRFLKEKKGIIISFIIGVIIASSITVYATSYFAKDIAYKEGKNVEQALDDLYLKSQTSDNCKYFEFNHEINTQFNYDFGFVPSSFIAFMKVSDGIYLTISLNNTSNGLIATTSDNFSMNSYFTMNSTKLTSNLDSSWYAYSKSYTIYVYAYK